MSMTIESVAERMKDGMEIPPHEAASMRVYLAGMHFTLSAELNDLEKLYPAEWNEIRETVKSDTQAERKYDVTPNGVRRGELRRTLKTVEKMLSALRSIHENYQHQAKNIF